MILLKATGQRQPYMAGVSSHLLNDTLHNPSNQYTTQHAYALQDHPDTSRLTERPRKVKGLLEPHPTMTSNGLGLRQ